MVCLQYQVFGVCLTGHVLTHQINHTFGIATLIQVVAYVDEDGVLTVLRGHLVDQSLQLFNAFVAVPNNSNGGTTVNPHFR
ncbi:MAG TPA: hypothetical protein VFM18_07575 [Methanosarcina sp.]|nr:hypothetical protein [Methanosarcina sp.]